MSDVIIKNVTAVNEGQRIKGDVLFCNGRIEHIGGAIETPATVREVNGEGKWLLPGVIDDQVHFRDFDLSAKGTIASESRAAAAGGVTSVMEMPNTKPPTTDWQTWRKKNAIGARDMAVNYAFYIGATNENADDILRDIPEGEICGLKIFMGSSTGNMLVNDPAVVERFFADWPGLIATHCEDEATIAASRKSVEGKYRDRIPPEAHPEVRNHDCCWRSSSFAVELAQRCGTRLHVLHLTTAKEVDQFSNAPLEKKRITSEVCVHHLTFDDRDYGPLGFQIKCNPAIKTPADRERLWQGLKEGRIDVIATDHAPHTWKEKATMDYDSAPAGLPLIQHPLGIMLSHVHDGRLSVEEMVDWMSHRVARCYRLRERGFLREGYFADAVLVDPDEQPEVCKEDLLYRCGWSPLEGRRLGGRVLATFVNGFPVYAQGQVDGRFRGAALHFDPHR